MHRTIAIVQHYNNAISKGWTRLTLCAATGYYYCGLLQKAPTVGSLGNTKNTTPLVTEDCICLLWNL